MKRNNSHDYLPIDSTNEDDEYQHLVDVVYIEPRCMLSWMHIIDSLFDWDIEKMQFYYSPNSNLDFNVNFLLVTKVTEEQL